MNQSDTIEIRRLLVSTRIGVPDEERSSDQTLWVTALLVPAQGFVGLADDISRTIDYHAVTLEIQALAASRPRNLIETLAVEVAEFLLVHHPLKRVVVTIEKQILPDTDFVAVHVTRER